MKIRLEAIALMLGACLGAASSATSAQESLDACSAEKIRQMELQRSIKHPPVQIDHYSRPRFDKAAAQDDISRSDEWLWKNCRGYSEEMRKIEQQYM